MNKMNEIRERLDKMHEMLLRIEDADDHARIHESFDESYRLVTESNRVRTLCEDLHRLYIDAIYERTSKEKKPLSDGDQFIFWGDERNEVFNFPDGNAV